MPAKLVVKKYRNGSRVTLVGPSGKELLASGVFTEPRAKGATLRSLKGLLGEDVVVEDYTTVAAVKALSSKAKAAPVAAAAKSAQEVVANVDAESEAKPSPRKATPRKSRVTK